LEIAAAFALVELAEVVRIAALNARESAANLGPTASRRRTDRVVTPYTSTIIADALGGLCAASVRQATRGNDDRRDGAIQNTCTRRTRTGEHSALLETFCLGRLGTRAAFKTAFADFIADHTRITRRGTVRIVACPCAISAATCTFKAGWIAAYTRLSGWIAAWVANRTRVARWCAVWVVTCPRSVIAATRAFKAERITTNARLSGWVAALILANRTGIARRCSIGIVACPRSIVAATRAFKAERIAAYTRLSGWIAAWVANRTRVARWCAVRIVACPRSIVAATRAFKAERIAAYTWLSGWVAALVLANRTGVARRCAVGIVTCPRSVGTTTRTFKAERITANTRFIGWITARHIARTDMVHANTGRIRETLVAVRHAVATAHRTVEFRASNGNRRANALEIATTLALVQLAKITGIAALNARNATAYLRALALKIHADTSSRSFTFVAIRHTIATTHGIPNIGASVRTPHTNTGVITFAQAQAVPIPRTVVVRVASTIRPQHAHRLIHDFDRRSRRHI